MAGFVGATDPIRLAPMARGRDMLADGDGERGNNAGSGSPQGGPVAPVDDASRDVPQGIEDTLPSKPRQSAGGPLADTGKAGQRGEQGVEDARPQRDTRG